MRIETFGGADVDAGVAAQATVGRGACAPPPPPARRGWRPGFASIRSSVRNSSLLPSRTACSASRRMRMIARAQRLGRCRPVIERAVDLLARTARRNAPSAACQSAPVNTGESSTSTRSRRSRVSRMLARFPNRVFSDITWRSRKRIDRRIGDLAKILPEELADQPRLVADDGKRRVVAHRPDRFLGALDHGAQDQFHILDRLARRDLPPGEFGAVVARDRPVTRGRADRPSCRTRRSSRRNPRHPRSGP